MKTSIENKAVVCKLTTPELQARKKAVIQQLKDLVLERIELTDGVKYKFDGSDAVVDMVASFIKTERLCCNFFDFNMYVSSSGDLWLELTGPAGTKDFINKEIAF